MSEKEKIPTIEGKAGVSDPAELAWAFPDVNAGQAPLGGRVIVQLRRIKKKAGVIIIVDETKENEKWNNMIGKVVAIGPLAYKNRDTQEPQDRRRGNDHSGRLFWLPCCEDSYSGGGLDSPNAGAPRTRCVRLVVP